MLTTDRPSQTLHVPLNLFPLPVIQVAIYTLLPNAEFELHEPEGDLLPVQLWPLEESAEAGGAVAERLQRELTAALFQRQAHEDLRAIRLLFALAAHDMNLPEAQIVDGLARLVEEPQIPESSESWLESLIWSESDVAVCTLASACEPVRAVRALSRMHDLVEATIQGRDQTGSLRIRLRLRSGAQREIEPLLRQLLARCGEGGLPAIYPPVHALERSYLQRPPS